MNRCQWVKNDPLEITYHDTEWGVPVHNNQKLFEFLILEGAQAGSKRREKARKRVAKIHAVIKDTRGDFLHQLSTRIVRENQTIKVAASREASTRPEFVQLTLFELPGITGT